MARGEIPPLLPPGDRHLHPPQAEGGHPTQDPEHPLPARHTPNHKGEQPHNTELHTLQPSRKTQRHSAPHTKAREASHSTPNQREHSFSVQAKGGQPGRSRSQANPEGQTATTPQHQLRSGWPSEDEAPPEESPAPSCKHVPDMSPGAVPGGGRTDRRSPESTPGPGGVDDPTLGWRGGTGGGERPGAPEHDPPRLLRLRPREPNQHNDEPEPQGSRST